MDTGNLVGGLICGAFWILICVGYFAYKHTKESLYRKNYFGKFGWIVQKEPSGFFNPSVNLRDKDLFYYIMKEYVKLKIPNAYHINYYEDKQDREITDEILQSFINDRIISYFCDTAKKENKFYSLNKIEYFMFCLLCFVSSIIDGDYSGYLNTDFANKIYGKREYTDKHFFNRELTDYGIVCFKLMLVASAYCQNNEKIKKFGLNTDHDYIKKCIDSKKVGFWSHRG